MTIYELLKRRTPQPGGVRALDLWPTGGGGGGSGEVRADLGFHKPVRVGKRRAESTASIHSNNNLVTVIDYANPNPNPNHNYQCERCRLCSSLTTANRFMRTQIVSHRRGRVPFTSVWGRDKSSVYYELG